jgi:hypothetical protein
MKEMELAKPAENIKILLNIFISYAENFIFFLLRVLLCGGAM